MRERRERGSKRERETHQESERQKDRKDSHYNVLFFVSSTLLLIKFCLFHLLCTHCVQASWVCMSVCMCAWNFINNNKEEIAPSSCSICKRLFLLLFFFFFSTWVSIYLQHFQLMPYPVQWRSDSTTLMGSFNLCWRILYSV